HMARTICRRAERAVVALAEQEAINEQALRYLNRLSDWLFMLARWENYSKKNEDILWNNTPPASSH
ncbi:MAG: ATP:cob(I)alamin adenosyltransferase, partial [Chloroflexi bacterium]|nr:ATP:cob(I)alamin adenosyltransferase [Chloroflexota bacterium]